MQNKIFVLDNRTQSLLHDSNQDQSAYLEEMTENAPPPNFFHYEPHYRDLSDIIYAERNTPVIDLHGMTVREAKEWCQYFIRITKYSGHIVNIITGKGLHSVNGHPVLKTVITKLLKKMNIEHGERIDNSGRLWAKLP